MQYKGFCAIIGSGFGLYGYLPSVVRKKYKVLLPQRYKDVFDKRLDLSDFSTDVEFVKDEKEAIDNSVLCVIAKRPQDQEYWVKQLLKSNTTKYSLLEKPLAPNPQQSLELLRMFYGSEKSFRIGYSFLYTEWGRTIVSLLSGRRKCDISICWRFMAYHFLNKLDSWKRFDSLGGGALRFYGIQIIALLATSENWHIKSSEIYQTNQNETYMWKAEIEYETGTLVRICVDSCCRQNSFVCNGKYSDGSQMVIYDGSFPFEAASDGLDSRVSILCELIDSFNFDGGIYTFYEGSVRLWGEIERVSKIITNGCSCIR